MNVHQGQIRKILIHMKYQYYMIHMVAPTHIKNREGRYLGMPWKIRAVGRSERKGVL